jgi:hypothetical protein
MLMIMETIQYHFTLIKVVVINFRSSVDIGKKLPFVQQVYVRLQ